jgi:DNA-binding transcriptional regulator LsrR (DeoR family)
MARRKNPHIGSSVETFLDEEGILASSTVRAAKAVVAWQIAEEMKRKGLTKTQMAARMDTSRAQLNRLLDAGRDVTLEMIARAAKALDKEIVLELR